MLADALKFLRDLGDAAKTPVKLDIADPRKVYYAIGNELGQHALAAPPRDHRPGTLEDLIALANRFFEDDHQESIPVVWYDRNRVVLVLDDTGHRLETATLDLDLSDTFSQLVKLRDTRPWFEPKPFVRLLRIELSGTLDPGELLERVRRVRFESGSITTTELARARESLGREITAKVDASGDLPEEVTLAVSVYRTPGEGERYPCRCAVEVDPAMGRLQLLPLPDEIERVWGLAVASIGARLRAGLDASIPCYQGRP